MSAAAQLRDAGLRATKQRIQVLEIVHSKRHVTVDQVVAECTRESAPIDLSTAYRTLEALDEAGLITHAHLGSGPPTYHPVDANPHVHLVCRSCDHVGSIPVAELAVVVNQVRVLRGFDVDAGHLVMHGRCADCLANAANSAPIGKSHAATGVTQG